MNCRHARQFMLLQLLDDSHLESIQNAGLAAHLHACPTCDQEYRESRLALQVLRTMPRAMLRDALAGKSPIRAADQPALRLHPATTGAARRPMWASPVWRTFRRAAALAACIALCFWAAGTTNQPLLHLPNIGPIPDTLTASAPIGTVVRLDSAGRELNTRTLLAGQSIVAQDHLRIRIAGRHDITLQPGTRLTADRSPDAGYHLAMLAGSIDIAVRRAAGEGLFRVMTPHADLTVTGTTFRVTCTLDQTRLHVLEGTVRMSTPGSAADAPPAVARVTAGRTFTSDGLNLKAVESSDLDTLLLAAQEMTDPVAALRHSPWYRQRFAPLLALCDHLAGRGEPVDELTLLAVSADLWCLQYPKQPGTGQPAYLHRRTGLERAAQFHGRQVQWIYARDASQARDNVREALQAGDLLLIYGWHRDQVAVADERWLADQPYNDITSYRFLGRPQAAADYILARVTPAASTPPDRQALARQALADIRNLLTETTDPNYYVGQSAVAAWSDAVGSPGNAAYWNDPLLRSLQAAAILAQPCAQRCRDLNAPMDLALWQSIARAIERHTDLDPDHDSDTPYCRTQQSLAQRQRARQLVELTSRIAQAAADGETTDGQHAGGH